jgi:hypothetical protein
MMLGALAVPHILQVNEGLCMFRLGCVFFSHLGWPPSEKLVSWSADSRSLQSSPQVMEK